jgi:hypothetical protein
MERNFATCAHCLLKGKTRDHGPSTRRTPLVSRSDGRTFHLYLEEQHPFSVGTETAERSTAALFRYDLDEPQAHAESTLVMIHVSGLESGNLTDFLERAADGLASVLAAGQMLRRRYELAASGTLT